MALINRFKYSIAIILVIVYLSLILNPGDYDVQTSRSLIEGASHVVMYCAFALILWFEYMPLYGAYALRHSVRRFKTWMVCFLLPFLFGFLMELSQKYLTTYRGFEKADIFYNLLGCVVAAALAIILIAFLRRRAR
ncbi:MAG: hypothetical protein KBS95_04635 [Alistipes sp.]|nr:hypothetical protein [Candidatus Alistipes equi]